jgi:hypothetical protein
MSIRAAAWLAWSVWTLCVVLTVLAVLLDLLTPSGSKGEFSFGLNVLYVIFSLLFPTVGALVASRHPHNLIGWTFCGTSLVLVGQGFADQYADYALIVWHGSLIGVKVMAWFSSWIGEPTLLLSLALWFLLFPNGRLPSRRWRPVLWSVIGASATFFLVGALTPGRLQGHESIANPVGVGGVVGDVLGTLGTIALVILLIACLASAISLILRWRQGRGQERQQLKWFVYPAALSAVGFVLAYVGAYVFASNLINAIGYWMGLVAFLALPVFTGIAILRYRLYDIDFIINRTLVYSSLTALLVLVYFGGVTATQAIFQTFTGQEELPQLAIVVSTLVIAALFNPLRRRIQGFIDRRFYRRKYDARKTLEAFSAKLSGPIRNSLDASHVHAAGAHEDESG